MKMRETVAMLAVALVAGMAYDALSERSVKSCACAVPLARIASAKDLPAKSVGNKTAAKAAHKVIVTYFHRNARCTACINTEAWTARAVQDRFAAEIKSGRLEWRVVNIDQPGNEHFVKDYNLSGSTAIVSDVMSGKQVRWKSLEKVWDLVGVDVVFQRYISDEVGAYTKRT